jgi:phosphopantetheine--protein transferase-like protein
LVTVGHTILHDPTPSELALIPSHERDRKFGSNKRRQQFLCGRSLLRRMLEDWTGEPAASHELTIIDDGKPVCVDGPAISITHAGDRVACSIAESGDIGIDLEVIDERHNLMKIAKKFFSAEESAWLKQQPNERFFMLWTLKEAYVKAIGRSIFGGINRLRCKVVPPDIQVMRVCDRMRKVCLFTTGGAFLALAATEDSLADVSIECWDADAGGQIANNEFHLLATSGDLLEHYASKK